MIYKQLINTKKIQQIKQHTTIQHLINFIDHQKLIPLFILLYFPFTPNTLINFITNLSHIKPKYYFIILTSSKLISTIILNYLNKKITTILTHPLKKILILIILIIF